jgi:hypothetical protein
MLLFTESFIVLLLHKSRCAQNSVAETKQKCHKENLK